MAAPLADDERPIPTSAPMCGEFINPLHYYCNLQQFPVSSIGPGGDANGAYFRWSGPLLLDHREGQFCPNRCHSESLILAYTLSHLLVTPDAR